MDSNMKTVNVVAAIIEKDHKIFATQRGYGEFKDGWEFPGGKIEAGTVDYDSPNFHLHMDCYLCSVVDGNLSLLEHEAAKWLGRDDLETVAWLEADLSIIEKLKEYLAK